MNVFRKPTAPQKNQTIRRVIKQGSQYICGLCTRKYAGLKEAEACLAKCSERLFAQDVKPTGEETKSKRYRCSFCKRIYDSAPSAKECARSCKQTVQKRMAAESKVRAPQASEEKLKKLALYASQQGEANDWNGGKLDTADDSLGQLQNVASKLKVPGAKAAGNRSYICEECSVAYATPHDAQDCFRKHKKKEKEEAAAKLAKAPAQTLEGAGEESNEDFLMDEEPASAPEAPAAGKAKEPKAPSADHKFFRDGAKYVCRNCSSKYFSKDEVIACFDGHEPEAEVYVTGRSPSSALSASATEEPKAPKAPRLATAEEDKHRFHRDGAKYVCRNCNKKYFTRDEVVACFDGHGPEAEVYVTGPAPTASSQPDTDKPAKSGSVSSAQDDKLKFHRDGAKYVCKKCNAKYFTRSEVVSCFDGHS